MSTTLQPPVPLDPTRNLPASLATPRRRTRVLTGRRLALIALAALVIPAAQFWFMQGPTLGTSASAQTYTVTSKSFPVIEQVKGELKAAKTTDIESKVEGRATIIWLIEEGATVKEGDLLVKLACDQIDQKLRQEEANEASAIASLEAAEKDLEILMDQNLSDIRKADNEVHFAEVDLRKYEEGDAVNALKDAQAEVSRAEKNLEQAQLKFDQSSALRDKKFVTTIEWMRDESSLIEARLSIEKAERNLRVLTELTQPKELRQAESKVEESKKEFERVKKSAAAKESQKHADVEAKRANLVNTQSELTKLREQKTSTEIKAPTPGLVVYDSGFEWDPKKIAVGTEVHERQTLVKLPDPSVMTVSVRIHEAKTAKVKVGLEARVEVEGLPGVSLTGKITRIAPLADSRMKWMNPDLKEYETEITLDANQAELKPGMTARTEINITQLDDVLAVPLQAVFGKGGKHFVFRPGSKGAEPVEVTLGEANTEYVSVQSGLDNGDEVLLAVTEADRRKLPEIEEDQRPNGEKGPPGQKAATGEKAARTDAGTSTEKSGGGGAAKPGRSRRSGRGGAPGSS